ncbi:MAG: hypothetical protein GWM98_04725 [Nitrospinaceae bacterium]|nr:hypothetical protein [Deltaproteobacteria bacterium]NIY14224.1 hypothetical protein [Nitrospinaceae bacterium]
MSQADGITKEIGDHKFTIYYLPPVESHDLLIDLAKMIGPSLGPVLGSVGSELSEKGLAAIMDIELDPEFLSQAASTLFNNLDKPVVKKVMEALRSKTLIDGKPLDKVFDVVFLGRLDLMYRWFFWGIWVQWGKSFGASDDAVLVPGALAQTG